MAWAFTSDLTEIPAAAEAWLLRDPVHNTVPLTVLDRCRDGLGNDGALLGWLIPDDNPDGTDVRGFVLHTPPYPVLLSNAPSGSVRHLAQTLATRKVSGVSGPVEEVDAFAAAWGHAPTGRMDKRLYRLGDLAEPGSTGRARRAEQEDLDLMVEWFVAFRAEAGTPGQGADPIPQMKQRIDRGELMVWQDEERVVAFAAFSAPIAEMSRIGPVYTPVDRRRRGYGTAVTHAATLAAREAGATEILLFTDLANPTSNSIYQALGYRPVADHATLFFG